MEYIGVDLHKQYFVATVMDEEGRVIRKDRVSTDRAAIKEYFQKEPRAKERKVAIEACYNWSYFFDEIQGMVTEVKLAHPLKTRAIAEARIKTDSIDSEVLAHLLRSDLIAEAYAPDFETRDAKNLLRYRASLSQMRTMLKNRVHATLARNHIEVPEFRELADKFGKKGRAYLREFQLRGHDTEILHHYLDLIDAIEEKIKLVDRKVKEACKRDEICRLIESIPGIGHLLAVLIRYEIDDIQRFSSAKKLCSYAGLVPSTYSSGDKTYHGRITKQGNRWLRWALTEAAQMAVVKDVGFRGYCRRVEKRGGKKKAKIAIARKLLEIIFCVWKERRPYYEKPVAVALVR
jgi:transposase